MSNSLILLPGVFPLDLLLAHYKLSTEDVSHGFLDYSLTNFVWCFWAVYPAFMLRLVPCPDPVENILMIEERHAEPRDRLCRHHPLGDIMREEGVEYDRIPDLESQGYSKGCKHEPACVKGAEA
jgi:hypothetical protein